MDNKTCIIGQEYLGDSGSFTNTTNVFGRLIKKDFKRMKKIYQKIQER